MCVYIYDVYIMCIYTHGIKVLSPKITLLGKIAFPGIYYTSDTSCAFFNFFPMTWGLFPQYNNWNRLNHIPQKAVLKSSLSPLQWDLIWKEGHCRCD